MTSTLMNTKTCERSAQISSGERSAQGCAERHLPLEPHRQSYETADHKAAELLFADDIAKHYRMELKPCAKFSCVDHVAYNDKGLRYALCELKCRNCHYGQYADLVLSVVKFDTISLAASNSGLRFLVFVRFTNADCVYVNMPDDGHKFRRDIGGRTKDTRDSRDIEPVIYIPTQRLIKFRG